MTIVYYLLIVFAVCIELNNFNFKHPSLQGLKSFEIAHGLWISNPEKRLLDSNNVSSMEMQTKKHIYNVSTKHGIYVQLRSKYGLGQKKRKRTKDNE